jgi:hypothetical protein
MLLRYEQRMRWEVDDLGELMSGKSLAFGYESCWLWVWSLEMVQRCGGYTYEQGELRGRVRKERRGKEMDGCPLILPSLQECSVTMHKDCQEVSRSTLVKGIESKMTALIWCAVPGFLWWNCTIFGFACSCVCTSH